MQKIESLTCWVVVMTGLAGSSSAPKASTSTQDSTPAITRPATTASPFWGVFRPFSRPMRARVSMMPNRNSTMMAPM